MAGQTILHAEHLSKQIGQANILNDVNLQINAGECFGIIGPNGSGKSTLVRLLSGVEPFNSGKVEFLDKALDTYSKKQLARHIAVLQQEALPPVGFTVREVVEMGRYPYQNWLGEEGGESEDLINSVLLDLDLTAFADRPVEALSGGERQRVALGKAVAQQPALLMLDEPTTYLDIGYQQQMMEYIKQWQRDKGLTVLAVLHDLNLAALYCDRIMVLHEGRVVGIGTPSDIIQAEMIERVYGVKPFIVNHPLTGTPQVLL